MTEPSSWRIQQFQPPARPEWVRRINEEGRCLDLKSVVPLDEDSLLRCAMANTGLSDFGADDGWREGLSVLVKALDEEADLTLTGRLMTRSDLLMHLEARLRIEDTYRRHPEIDDQPLAPVMLIVGSGRSGTSAMQNLLAQDPDNGSPRHWEALIPCPPPEAASYHSDPRIGIAHERMDMWNRVTPEVAAQHEFGGDMPTEMIQIEAISFQSNGWLDLYGFVPSYDAWLSPRSYVPAFSCAKRVLKLLQWKNPRKRWVLKSPDAMRHMPDLYKVFPELQLVWMHRDPVKAVASAVSLIGTLYWIRSDQPLNDQAIAQLTHSEGLAGLFDKVMDEMDSGEVPADQVCSIQYSEFVENPMATVEQIYAAMGQPLTDTGRAAMERYLRERPRESRPAHRYVVGEGDQLTAERQLFARYEQRFGVRPEC